MMFFNLSRQNIVHTLNANHFTSHHDRDYTHVTSLAASQPTINWVIYSDSQHIQPLYSFQSISFFSFFHSMSFNILIQAQKSHWCEERFIWISRSWCDLHTQNSLTYSIQMKAKIQRKKESFGCPNVRKDIFGLCVRAISIKSTPNTWH